MESERYDLWAEDDESAEEHAEHLERVSSRIGLAIIDYLREHRRLHAEDLRQHVVRETGIAAPASAHRILRDLRQKRIIEDAIGINHLTLRIRGETTATEIDRILGQRLPVATMFRAQTVEQMAAVLSQCSAKPWSSLVTLQPQGLRSPLFVIPAADANALAYVEFAKCLGSDQPIHVLQPVGLERVTGSPWSEPKRSPNISSKRFGKCNPGVPTDWRVSASAESPLSRWLSNSSPLEKSRPCWHWWRPGIPVPFQCCGVLHTRCVR
jgi:hypothetical protein